MTTPTTIAELAAATGTRAEDLQEMAEAPPYDRWKVRKRSGGFRQIEAPTAPLKSVQRWVLHNVVPLLPLHEAAHGCVPGRSAKTFADVHAGATTLVRMDVRSFFPSVSLPNVSAILRTVLSSEVASVVAGLCTSGEPRCLPQGAPTSPGLANAVCLDLDRDLEALAKGWGAKYSRYVDDLAFSMGRNVNADCLVLSVSALLVGYGFKANEKKTKISGASGRQELVGLVVNGGAPRPRRSMLRNLRAAIHQSSGASKAEIRRIRGMISYVSMTNPEKGKALRLKLDRELAR